MGNWRIKISLVVMVVAWLGLLHVALGAQSLGPMGENMASLPHLTTTDTNLAQPLVDNLEPDSLADPLDAVRLRAGLENLRLDGGLATRGAREIQLYRSAAPAVVLVLTNEGFGSGAVISNDGKIVTNWHVVEDYEEVGVVFLPTKEGRKFTQADVQRAQVLWVDEVADLALLKVPSLPSHVRPLHLGSAAKIQVGSDVHAIGHPTGQSWTYTKGLVSQLRNKFEWATDAQRNHRADVIQTQTPINPGNSGGPLLNDAGELIGINSFKAQGEALNFAVSVEEVKRFLSKPRNRRIARKPPSSECDAQELGTKRDRQKRRTITAIDFDCDGKADAWAIIPDDPNAPWALAMDYYGSGGISLIHFDDNHDGKVDRSLHDTNKDGKPDLIGYHRNGDLRAYRFEPYVG